MWCLPSEGVREPRIPLGEFRLPPELDRLPGKHLQRVNEKKRGKKKTEKGNKEKQQQ